MRTISITYALKWQLDFANHICFDAKGQAFNTRTGRKLKRCYNGRSVGHWIGRDWHSLKDLRVHLTKIKNKEPLPF